MSTIRIPQTSPIASYIEHREEIDAAIERVLSSGHYIQGPEGLAFETEFATFVAQPHVAGVGNGTDALHLALRAAGVRPDDLVVTVSNTAVATAAAIEMAGGRLAFVDVDPRSLTMSPASLEEFLHTDRGRRTRAVVPVHLFGRLADMDAIAAIASKAGLVVVEDCAQAHGATLRGRHAGAWSHASSFSFYPTKNLSTFGDGGAVASSSDEIDSRVRSLRQYGWESRDDSLSPGFNSRLDELHAAILRVRLRYLEEDNERRRSIARRYDEGLSSLEPALLLPPPEDGHVYHQYVVRSQNRDALRARLSTLGVQTLVHYPKPIHTQRAYRGRVITPEGGLPQTEQACNEILSLPIYPQLTERDQSEVIASVRDLVHPGQSDHPGVATQGGTGSW